MENQIKILKTKSKSKFTDVQVRILNTSYNFKKALVRTIDQLLPYIDTIRKEATDSHGRPNWQKFTTLPLVSFVDPNEMEEIVFKTEKDLPTKATEIRTSKGTLIASITTNEK